MKSPASHAARGLTVIELIVVVAVSAVLIAIAAPSLTELIATQRLRSINAELITDMQYARGMAISRNSINVRVQFQRSSTMSCYVIFLGSFRARCDCTLQPGSVCVNAEEVRTTQILSSTDVQVTSLNGGLLTFTADGLNNMASNYQIATTRISGAPGQYLNTIGATGRPSACYSATAGTPTC